MYIYHISASGYCCPASSFGSQPCSAIAHQHIGIHHLHPDRSRAPPHHVSAPGHWHPSTPFGSQPCSTISHICICIWTLASIICSQIGTMLHPDTICIWPLASIISTRIATMLHHLVYRNRSTISHIHHLHPDRNHAPLYQVAEDNEGEEEEAEDDQEEK